MNQFEQYKRLIKLGFALILVALLTGLYGVIWINWYNKIIWAPFFRRGNWMMIFIYGLLLIFFMQLYGGFKIALLKRGNLIYSQILAVVVTNIIRISRSACRIRNSRHLCRWQSIWSAQSSSFWHGR